MKKYFIIIAAAIAFAGCTNSADPVEPVPDPVPEPEQEVLMSVIEIPVSESLDFDADNELANEALNKFSFNLFNETAKQSAKVFADTKKGNFSVSPLSMLLSTSMVSEAVDEETGAAMADVLSGSSLANLANTCNKLMRYLPSKSSGANLELANSVWFSQAFSPQDSFVERLKSIYYSEVMPVNMSDYATAGLINLWCKSKTHGLIDEIVGDFTPNSDAMFINALYFRAEWYFAFDEKYNKQIDFVGTSVTTTVDMMKRNDIDSYAWCDRFNAVSLPFKGETAMAFLLPKGDLTADELAHTLSLEEWNNLNFRKINVNLSVPKFEIVSTGNLSAVADAIGLPVSARLSGLGITEKTSCSIMQKTAIKINEAGAEGASATVHRWGSSSGDGRDPDYAEFHLTRPFVYLVYSTRTGTVLLAGVINNL